MRDLSAAALSRYRIRTEGACDGEGAIFDAVGVCGRCGRSYDTHLLRELLAKFEQAVLERMEFERHSAWNARRVADADAYYGEALETVKAAEAILEAVAADTSPHEEAAPAPPTIHGLKAWPEFFAAVKSGAKRHEVRKDDRPYAVGHLLLLQEYKPEEQVYTGAVQLVRVTFITRAFLPPGLVAMSIELASLVVPE